MLNTSPKESYFMRVHLSRIFYTPTPKSYCMDIEEKLEHVRERFEEVTAAMSDSAVYDNPDRYTELIKEHSELKELVELYEQWKDIGNQIEGNEELIDEDEDEEIAEMADGEP